MLYSTPTQTLRLSAEEVEFYREHGWVMTAPALDDSLIDSALDALAQHWSGHRDREFDGKGTHFSDWMPGDADGTRNNEYLSLRNEKFKRLAWSPSIAALSADAAETEEVRLFDDQIVYKPGGQKNAVVGWHVDGDYWGTCTSWNMLTAWVPLHDCPEEMGPIVVLDGSHKWSHKLDRSVLSFHSPDMDALQRNVEKLGYEFKPVTLAMKRGQFSLHHCRAIHGSYPNRSSQPRIAAAIHFQDQANAYQRATRPDGRQVQLFNDLICGKQANGDPDYRDPVAFPVLWRSVGYGRPRKGKTC